MPPPTDPAPALTDERLAELDEDFEDAIDCYLTLYKGREAQETAKGLREAWAALRAGRARAATPEPKRIRATGYVQTGGRVDIMTTDRTATCPHCDGALVLPAPFRHVDESEFADVGPDPWDESDDDAHAAAGAG